MVLPALRTPPFTADLVFGRDGRGFFVQGLHGALRGAPDEEQPPPGEWGKQRHYLQRDRTSGQRVAATLYLRTHRQLVARATVSIVDSYSTGSAVLQWVLAPGKEPVFAAGPTGLRFERKGKVVVLRWDGGDPRYRVEVDAPGKQTNRVVTRPEVQLEPAPEGLHRIRIRRILPNGASSLPSSLTLAGTHRKTRRGVVEYPDRWYDQTGGLDLQKGAPGVESVDVVFYLYGVHAGGGAGVQKVGSGRERFDALAELPDTGYLPVYGRIDEHDVLAVRLADGRHAKLYLEPMRDNDVRDGMRVHFAFLTGGGRRFLPRPDNARFERRGNKLTLTWARASGIKSYRVECVEDPSLNRSTGQARLELDKLQVQRFYNFRLIAIDGRGEASDPAPLAAHTFGPEYRVGRVSLSASRMDGYRFQTDEVLPGGGAQADLQITNSAGGATALGFAAGTGAASTRGAPFGSFPPESTPFAKDLRTDDRQPRSQVFWVKSDDGGVACVRIRGVKYPLVHLDSVWRRGKR